MNTEFISVTASIRKSPLNVAPPENYSKPQSEETEKEYPFCCSFHTEIYENATIWHNKLLVHLEEFVNNKQNPVIDKEYYANILDKIFTQLSYTEYFIFINLNKGSWYEIITDYIDYNIESFGLPATGSDVYLTALRYCLNNNPENKKLNNRKDTLITYISEKLEKKQPATESNSTDFNLLNNTYQKWLKIFPFNLSLYQGLKQSYENKLPFLKSEFKTNSFTNTKTATLHTKDSFIEALLDLTRNLLTQINTYWLYNRNELTNPEKTQLELILEKRKNTIEIGYSNNTKDEGIRYRKILKEWYEDEIDFIKEITPFISTLQEPEESLIPESDSLKTKLLSYDFHKLPKVKSLTIVNRTKLIEILEKRKVPYAIAMFDYLDYIPYLLENYFKHNSKQLHKEISNWLKIEKSGRTIRGHINSLKSKSEEDKDRYTAHKYKEEVKKDYEQLK